MPDSHYRYVEVHPLAGGLGAEVLGVDISAGLSEQQFAETQRAFAQFGVVFFRDQNLTPEQHIAFACQWGDIDINRFFEPVEGYPQIAEVRKEPKHEANIGGSWHTDHSYDQRPALGSMLYAYEVPSSGGDTMFASMYRAYDTLSDGMKTLLGGLRAQHSSRHVFGPDQYRETDDFKGRVGNPELATQDATHPVVVTHPLTKRKVLYVNPGFTVGIEGWSQAESKALLEFLYAHAVRPEFTCRFRWENGSIAFWDNRATWHYALNDYPGKRRFLHRITIAGTTLAA